MSVSSHDPALDLGRRLMGSAALAASWRQTRLPAGHLVFDRGDPADACYVVASGELDVVTSDHAGGRMVLEHLGPGQCFGELGLLDDGPRAAGVVAVTEAVLKVLTRADFLAHVWRDPDLAEAAGLLLGARMRRTNAFLDYVTRWAGLVAEGRYDDAQQAVGGGLASVTDPDVARFAETFQAMVASVREREVALTGELLALRVEFDRQREAREVAAIADSDFFQALQGKADVLRRRRRGE